MGLGAAAPLFAAATSRYVGAHFGRRPSSRFVALIGDAELDEGNIWEAVADPATTGLGRVMWLVDFNPQSLDRVVPGVRIDQWRGQFEAAGWHVVEVKYGRRLEAAYARPGGEHLRAWIDAMPNEQYQSLFGLEGEGLRKQFLDGAPDEVERFVADVADDELGPLVTDLGGHDLEAVLEAYAQCDAVEDRPSVVFAYTVKGWGLHAVPLGVDEFGQSGSVRELYELHDLIPGSIVNAALAALSLGWHPPTGVAGYVGRGRTPPRHLRSVDRDSADEGPGDTPCSRGDHAPAAGGRPRHSPASPRSLWA